MTDKQPDTLRAALAAPQQAAPAVPYREAAMKKMQSILSDTLRANQKAAPQQVAPAAEWLEQAYREGWAACRDAETIGEDAEDWAFGHSTANSRMIDMQQAAPQQEVPAQPDDFGSVLDCSLHGNSVTFNFGHRDEAERWHDAVADAWDAARKEGK